MEICSGAAVDARGTTVERPIAISSLVQRRHPRPGAVAHHVLRIPRWIGDSARGLMRNGASPRRVIAHRSSRDDNAAHHGYRLLNR